MCGVIRVAYAAEAGPDYSDGYNYIAEDAERRAERKYSERQAGAGGIE